MKGICPCKDCKRIRRGTSDSQIDWGKHPEQWADHWRNRAAELRGLNWEYRSILKQVGELATSLKRKFR